MPEGAPEVGPEEGGEAADSLIGRLVDDRYTVLEAMASGSMGAVYKAERVPVGKLVAIKFLHAAFAKDSEFLARFERETRVMSKLAHPNCVSVVDFGVFEGAPYLVMDYVAGTTLRAVMDHGPIDPPRALALVRQVAAGLAHAHAQGVVHRDVKPANLMISEEIGTGEHIRILDFGLARLRGNVGRDATQNNVVVGTPNYMAPEQTIGGGTIDARTDVYAVGVVLFEMIAGERPFHAEDTFALLGMHRAAPIPKLADRVLPGTELPAGLQALIEKAMAKSPDDRFQSAIELATAIDNVLTGKATAAPDHEERAGRLRRLKTDPAAVAPTQVDISTDRVLAPTPPRRASTLTAVLAVTVLLAAGAYAAWYVTRSDVPTTAATVTPPDPAGMPDAASAGSAVVADAAEQVAIAPVDAAEQGSADDVGSGSGSAGDVGSGSGSAEAGSGSAVVIDDQIIMEPDPEKAENLAPKAPDAEDEADDAPDDQEVEKRAPAAPVLARTIHDAVVLIKEGKTDLAISSLYVLKKKNPRSAYVPFLLGNLYFDKRWWSVALGEYRTTVARNAGYGKNPVLVRNVIRMLASSKLRGPAEVFLRGKVGTKTALAYLRVAMHHDSSATVRKQAKALYTRMGGR